MKKQILVWIFTPFVLFGVSSFNPELCSKPIKCRIYEDNTEVPIRFDTTRIFPPPTPSGTFRDVAVARYFKGPEDDTVRIFTVMSTAPFYAMLFNDTTTNPPLKVATSGWQIHGNNGRFIDSSPAGFWGAAVGDVDNDDVTDMVYGEAAAPYRLIRTYWNGISWSREVITTLNGAIRDIAIGDADNNGAPDIVVAAGNSVYRIRRSGSTWQRDSLYSESYRISGVAVGDYNPAYPGYEIIAVSYSPQVRRIHWTGSNWFISQPANWPPGIVRLDDVAIGDFDPDSVGNEVIIINGYNFESYGNVWICYFRGQSFYYSPLGAWFHSSGWGQEGEVQIGDVYELSGGNEVLLVPGNATGTYAVPMVLWRQRTSADSVIFWIRALPNTGGNTYGIAIGDVNKHRRSLSQELVITGNNRVYECEQRLLYNRDIVARRISFEPNLVCERESVSVKFTIMNYGYQTQETIPVAYEVLGRIVVETCYTRLTLGDSVIYQFRNKHYCQFSGDVYFKAYSCLRDEEYLNDDTVYASLSVRTRLEGTKNVGPGGDFSNLTSALNYFHNSIITGHVTFKLTGLNYLNEALPLKCSLPVAYRESIWSLTIRPGYALRPTIQGNNANAIFELVEISRVTLDSLVIINTNNTGAVIRFRNGASGNTVVNCKIQGSSSVTTTGAIAFLAGSATRGNNNNLISNCEITRYSSYPLDYGIYFAGGTVPNDNNIIKKCKIYDFRNTGIYLKENTYNTVITECEIFTQTPQVSSYLCAITCYDFSVIGTKIIGNKIKDLYTLQSNSTIKGIYLWEGSNEVPTLIANNFIILDGDITHPDATLYGIHEDTYLNRRIDIYYNSIYIGGLGLTNNSKYSYGLYRNYPCNMNFKNNIIFNNRQQSSGTGRHYAVYCANIYGTFDSDYNDLYVFGAHNQYIGYWGTTNCLTLNDWKNISGRDAHSISKNPNYVSQGDLHINPNSPYVNKKAISISGIINDIDNEVRDPINPDIGADEYIPNPPQPFVLISPDSAASLVPINGNLIWRSSLASEFYEVLLDTINPPQRIIRSWYSDTICPYETLLALKTYYWQVKAYNDTVPNTKAIISSPIWHFTTVPLPNPPSNLRITNLYATAIELAWRDNSNDELGFYILLATSPTGNYTIVDSTTPNDTIHLLSNLGPNQRYWIRVASYNQYGFRGYAQTDTITRAQVPGPVLLDSISYRKVKMFLNPAGNPSYTRFCVKITDHYGNVKYLHPSGLLVDTAVFAPYANFGGENGIWIKRLYPNTSYTFSAQARNEHGILSSFGPSNTQTTLPPLQTFYSESFEGLFFPPFGWETEVIVSGGTNWSRVNIGQNPSQTPYHGTAQAQYNAYQTPPNAHARLITPPISLRGVTNPVLKFYMYHNHTNTLPDSLVIEVSTDNGNTWRRKEKFLRYASYSGWQLHTVSLAGDRGTVALISFHGYSAGGNNIYIDSVAITSATDVMISDIIRPDFSEYKRVTFQPQVLITNNSATGVNVPVVSKIWTFAGGFYQGFDSLPFPPVGWVIYNNDLGTNVWRINTNLSNSGPGCAMSIGEGYLRNDDWLITKQFRVNNNDTLKFYYCKRGGNAACSLEVWLSTTTNALTDFNVRLDAFAVSNTGYLSRQISLNPYNGQNIYLAFVNKSFSSDTILLDDISISYRPANLLYYDSTNVVLQANSSLILNFNSYTPSTEGQYRFFSYINLPSDFVFWNNYQERIFEVIPFALMLIRPQNGEFTNDLTPTFIWRKVIGAVQYRIQIATDSNFTNIILDELVSETTYTVDSAHELSDGTYFWRVRVNLPSPPDPYSSVWRFILDTEAPTPPTLISPVNGYITNNTRPTFIWRKVRDAISYRFFLYDSTYSQIFCSVVSETTFTLQTNLLTEARYYWSVACRDSAGNWSNPATPWELIIDLTPPEPPILISPRDGETIEGQPQLFIWHSVSDASAYNIIITPSADSIITSDTFYYAYLDRGIYCWKVRARDSAGNWSSFSEVRSFNVFIGWVRRKALPSREAYRFKFVKDGGALVSTDSFIYAFRGNKSHEFYKYLPQVDSWVTLETLKFAPTPNDPTKYTKKKVGKGAALCYDGENTIYALKGNGTRELWRYNIQENSWQLDTFVPYVQGLKGGSALLYLNGTIYLLAGSQKIGENNFFAYIPQNRTWQILARAPIEPDGKSFKDGSALAELGGKIYALKGGGKYNYFYEYSIGNNTWTHLTLDSIPQAHSFYARPKKTKVKDGAAMVRGDNRIFAIKGGKRNELWCYNPNLQPGRRWVPLETIPRALENFSKSVPATGASLAFLCGRLYLLKGNNTDEFWSYISYTKNNYSEPLLYLPSNKAAYQLDKKLTEAIDTTTIISSSKGLLVPINNLTPLSHEMTIMLYNSVGQKLKTIALDSKTNHLALNDGLNPGVYFIKFYVKNHLINEFKLIIK